MRKISMFISVLTLILGFTFYGEHVIIPIYDRYYIIAAEVLIFGVWALFILIFQIFIIRRYLRNRAFFN